MSSTVDAVDAVLLPEKPPTTMIHGSSAHSVSIVESAILVFCSLYTRTIPVKGEGEEPNPP